MKTYLITGGAGFIGANFVKYMLKKYTASKIVVLDKLTYAGNLKNLQPELNNIEFIKGDIANQELVEYIFINYDIDYVINFAAESDVDKSIKKPQVFFNTNILGTQTLLETAKKFWNLNNRTYQNGVKYLQVSTDEVYGSLSSEGYFTEQTPLNPSNPYASSKASADLIVKAYYETYKLPINITRCSNNYGPYQFPEKLIPLFVTNALNNQELPLYGDGQHIRDWLHVKDHCQAIDKILHQGTVGDIYNIGGNNEQTNLAVAKTILQELNKPESLITYVSDRLGHDYRYAIEASKLKTELGWEPEYNFKSGIKKTIQWYQNNENWWRELKNENQQEYYSKLYVKE